MKLFYNKQIPNKAIKCQRQGIDGFITFFNNPPITQSGRANHDPTGRNRHGSRDR